MLEEPVSDDAAMPGLAMMGMRTQSCPDGLHVVEPIGNGHDSDAQFEGAFRSLSAQVGALGRPLSFMLVLLESVGAEDIHALSETAPEGLTPYLDQLVRDSSQVLVGRRFYQAGQRTAGAMSSMLCGVGAAPFGLAPLRDLPSLKFRCWSDLAAQAGADLRFFYADNLSFDRYDGSLRDHGFRYLHTPQVDGRPRGAWGLSDREIFKDVLADLKQTSPGVSPDGVRIRGVLTLSTHGPFDVPEDMPADARERAQSLARGAAQNPQKQAHWVTVSYLDEALSRFIPAFIQAEESAGRTPVVLMLGDHTSGMSQNKNPLSVARIAPIWVFPSAIDPKWFQPVQREFDARNWSQNDLPRMILALLDGAGGLRSLPQSDRWHSMGGQALNASFSVPRRPGRRRDCGALMLLPGPVFFPLQTRFSWRTSRSPPARERNWTRVRRPPTWPFRVCPGCYSTRSASVLVLRKVDVTAQSTTRMPSLIEDLRNLQGNGWFVFMPTRPTRKRCRPIFGKMDSRLESSRERKHPQLLRG